ncbi:hypothetical protein HPULCUR_006794 [Helicostylum pulchrum]|uniref:F-box domain-containing protein n=1 Tax=Helicostylum pulchrum TaxID=562976 RepID=A0ABP9Y3F6_9FUNG
MDSLPTEAYYRIFDYLSRPDILICSFVCRQWNLVAVQVYNKVLRIDYRKVRKAKKYLAGDDVKECFKNGHLVRRLIFASKIKDERLLGDLPEEFSRTEFLSLLEQYLNIEEIDFSTRLYDHEGFRDNHQNCFSTCLRYSTSLTSLCLKYTKHLKDYAYRSVDVLDLISQFKSLKELEFFNSYYDSQIMSQILEICPQLTDLIVNNEHADSFYTTQESLDQKTIIPIVKSSKNLRNLAVRSQSSLSLDFTKYLTSFIEDGLKTLNIMSFIGLCDWIEEAGMENALELMKKLGQTNAVDAIKWSKSVSCDITFVGFHVEVFDQFMYISSDKRISLVYGLDGGNFEDEEPLTDFPIHNRSILNVGLESVDRLVLDIENYDSNVMKFLKYAFTNCVNLLYLKIPDYLEIQKCPGHAVSELGSLENNLRMINFLSIEASNKYFTCFDWTMDLTCLKSLDRCYCSVDQYSMSPFAPDLSIKFKYLDGNQKLYYYNTKRKKFLAKKGKQNTLQLYTFICEKGIDFVIRFDYDDTPFSLANIKDLPNDYHHIIS